MSDAFYPGQTDYLHKLSEMWDLFEDAVANATGPQGWSPSLAVVTDGERRVLQLIDWIGGESTKPTLTGYLGITGIVSDVEDAIDIRGASGSGGGSTTLAALTDVDLDSITDNQILLYDSSTSKWINSLVPDPTNYRNPSVITGLSVTPDYAGHIHAINTNTFRNVSSSLYDINNLATPTGKWVDSITTVGYGGLLTAINLGDIEGITSSFTGSISSVLSFTANSLKYAQSLTLANLGRLTTLSLPELILVGSSMNLIATSISLPKLEAIVGVSTFDASTIDLPELRFAPACNALCTFTGGAVTINAPKLEVINALNYSSINTTSHSYPELRICYNGITIGNINVTTVNLPKLEILGIGVGNFNSNCNISGQGITSISFPSLKQIGRDGQNQTFSITSPINQASVDGILVKLASLDGTNGYEAFSTRTVNLNGASTAAPSATGLTAKATLIARGCTVNHN